MNLTFAMIGAETLNVITAGSSNDYIEWPSPTDPSK